MKGKIFALLCTLVGMVCLLAGLFFTQTYWLPRVAGYWLPSDIALSLEDNPRLTTQGISIAQLGLQAGQCTLLDAHHIRLNYSSPWRLAIGELTVNSECFKQLATQEHAQQEPGLTLQQWQEKLPVSQITIDQIQLLPWPAFGGKLAVSLTPEKQHLTLSGSQLELAASLQQRQLVLETLQIRGSDSLPPLQLAGKLTLALDPSGLPPEGKLVTSLVSQPLAQSIDIVLAWQRDRGTLHAFESVGQRTLLSLPWQITDDALTINDGMWYWPYIEAPLSGGLALRVQDWRAGLDKLQISGRANLVSQGNAGKGNAVLTFGPGTLDLQNKPFPLQLVGEIKYQQLIGYAVLPGQLSGELSQPVLTFLPGALLRSRGQISQALSIDDVRLPLAGIAVSADGVTGRLQAILKARQHKMGELTLHLDGRAEQFMPDQGLWQWRYWGNGQFLPLDAAWDVSGSGEWRDSQIAINRLSTGFKKLEYGAMFVTEPRLQLTAPVVWQRDELHPHFSGELTLNTGIVHFGEETELPDSRLSVTLNGKNPNDFQFKGELQAGGIGPVRVTGRFGEQRVRGNAWWPQQSIQVFQPLIPAEWKMHLAEGTIYAQTAFSAAADQGFIVGGHGVVRNANFEFPDNGVLGIDFILPFRYGAEQWQFGTRGPVTLNIAEVRNQFKISNITASMRGWYPWSERQPLTFSDISADLLDGNLMMRQLRLPQKDAALLRLSQLSSSALMAAINPKQFTFSGRFDGALPIWLNHPQWIIKEGWLMNSSPVTFRMDKDMADAIVAENMAAGLGINWLRYLEIAPSWARVSMDTLGNMNMEASVNAISRVQDKTSQVRLNYRHQENLFSLWRSLRFADNLQTWIEKNAMLKRDDLPKPDGTNKEMP